MQKKHKRREALMMMKYRMAHQVFVQKLTDMRRCNVRSGAKLVFDNVICGWARTRVSFPPHSHLEPHNPRISHGSDDRAMRRPQEYRRISLLSYSIAPDCPASFFHLALRSRSFRPAIMKKSVIQSMHSFAISANSLRLVDLQALVSPRS